MMEEIRVVLNSLFFSEKLIANLVNFRIKGSTRAPKAKANYVC